MGWGYNSNWIHCNPRLVLSDRSAFLLAKKLVNFRVFLKIGSYIHGSRGFANQIYINHRIGSSLESNKQETFEQILDWPMKKLLLSMGNILPNNCKNIHYKSIEFCKIPFLHQALLKDNGYDILDSTLIQISNLITIKDSLSVKSFLK